MKPLRFEWDEAKNRESQRKHGVSFEEARTVFYDEEAIEFFDDDHSYEALMAGLTAWAHRTTKLICGHDFNDPMYPGVKQAVYEFFGKDRVKQGPDSIWYIQ